MRKKKFLWAFGILFVTLLLYGCEMNLGVGSDIGETVIDRVTQERLSNIPFESEYVLKGFEGDPGILAFDTARRVALVEFLATEFDVEMGWEGHRMMPRPVVIYGFDNRPRFYDFIVVDAEQRVAGTITVYARRAAPTTIRAVRHGVRDYRSVLSRAGFEASLFEDWRGGSFLGLRGRAGDIPTLVMCAETGETVTGITEPEIDGKIAELLGDELFMRLFQDTGEDTYLTTAEIEAALRGSHGSYAANAEIFWMLMYEVLPEIALLEDEDELIDSSSRFLRAIVRRIVRVVTDIVNGNIANVDSRIFLPRYTDHNQAFRPNLRDWCGPWLVAYLEWIRNGRVGDRYSSALSYTSNVLGFLFGGEPMTPWAMNMAMLHVSSGRVGMSSVPHFDNLGLYNQIRNQRRPAAVITIRNNQLHWELVVGARRSGNVLFQNYHFLLHDNNTAGRNGIGNTTVVGSNNRRYHNSQYRSLNWLYPWFMVFD